MTPDPASRFRRRTIPRPAACGSRWRAWLEALAVYQDRRVLSMLFLGFSSGLPFGALAEPLSAWLTESGLGKPRSACSRW